MPCDPASQNAVLSFATGNFPEGYCPNSYQQLAIDIAHALSGYLPGNFTSFNIGSTEPTPENRDKPWLQLDAATCRPIRIYYWSGDGAWVSLHPDFPGKVVMYEGLEADVETLDGGEAGAVTATTGPMWEIVTEMAARFPMGPGTLPGYQIPPVPVVVPVGATGGLDGKAITQTSANLPAHNHQINCEASDAPDAATTETQRFTVADGTLHWRTGVSASAKVGFTRDNTIDPGGVTPLDVPTVPPYRAIWFIRKTARLYYRI